MNTFHSFLSSQTVALSLYIFFLFTRKPKHRKMYQLILFTMIFLVTTTAAPRSSSLRSSFINSRLMRNTSSDANYENFWVPLRAAMKRNIKQLEENTEILRKKFAEFTNQSTSFDVALIDSQIQEVLETIDRLQKQLDRTPERIILPRDPSRPDLPSTTQTPATTTTVVTTSSPVRTTSAFIPSWKPPTTIITRPTTRPPSTTRSPSSIPIPILPSQPEQSWYLPNIFPAIAGFLTIDTGANEAPSSNKPASSSMNWLNNPSFTDFLNTFLR